MKKELPLRVRSISAVIYCLFMLIMFDISIFGFVNAMKVDGSKYEIKLEDNEYTLFIDNKSYGAVDYNEYSTEKTSQSKGEYAKRILICNYVKSAVTKLLMTIILCFILAMTDKIRRGEEPYKKNIIKYIRLAGLFSILLGIIPELVYFLLRFFLVENAIYHFNDLGLTIGYGKYFIALGATMLFIYNLLEYGLTIKEDNDLIA